MTFLKKALLLRPRVGVSDSRFGVRMWDFGCWACSFESKVMGLNGFYKGLYKTMVLGRIFGVKCRTFGFGFRFRARAIRA